VRKTAAEMVAEFLREVAVLVLVFALLDVLLTIGIAIERVRAVE
jgi:hypothetical protein